MADRPHQVQVHPRFEALKGTQRRPSTIKLLAAITLAPVGGGLLALAGITFVGTLIGLAVTFPLYILFSPVLLPAALVFGFAVAAILTSGAFGLTGLTSLTWVLKLLWEVTQAMPQIMEQGKRRMQEMAGLVGQKTREMGQDIQRKAQEGK